MTPTITDYVQAGAAVLTMGAAIIALVIASKAPRLAAKYAEQYRRDNAKADERDRLRMSVLLMLLRGRKQLLHQDSVAALNIVDLAFADVPAVRNAHRVFVRTTFGGKPEEIVSAYHVLILAAADAVGLGDTIGSDDLHNGYYPESFGMLDAAAMAEAEQKLAAKAAAQSPELGHAGTAENGRDGGDDKLPDAP